MAAKLNMFVFLSLVAAAMLHGSSAQTTHVVGDALGWLVPPGGQVAYQTWARGQSFRVGDILVFNFTTQAHDVLEVTRAEFDSCNLSTTTTPPITTSPANITLSTAGEHYYICTFPQHCPNGQKLAINVTAGGPTPAPAPAPSTSATPAPSPTTPPPSSATPSPSPTTPPPSSATPPPSPATPPSSSATPPPSPSAPTPTTPSTPSSPTPVTSPPPPSNSAPSFAVAALPFTFLAVALAFLYN